MERVLITGGAGFIGSHLAEYLAGRAAVRILDNFRTGHRRNLRGLDVELIEGSILDAGLVRRAVEGVDRVFHLAALVSVEESMRHPRECAAVNVEGLLHVLEAAAAAGVRRLVFSSSAAVYGDRPEVPKTEAMCPDPKSPYAITKLDGEYYCRLFREDRGLPTVCLRYFNVYGPRQDPASPYAAAVPIFLRRALDRQSIEIFGDGGQTRDFIFVRDVAAANWLAAHHPEAAGVYNVGNGSRLSIAGLAELINRLAGSNAPVRGLPERPGDVRDSQADISRLDALGFRPSHSFEEGLRATLADFRNHGIA